MAKKKTLAGLTIDDFKTVLRDEVRVIVHDELVPIDFRLTNLEGEFKIMNGKFEWLGKKFDLLDSEFKDMQKNFEERFDRMTNGIDKLLGVGKNHAEDHAANQTAHARYEEKFNYA